MTTYSSLPLRPPPSPPSSSPSMLSGTNGLPPVPMNMNMNMNTNTNTNQPMQQQHQQQQQQSTTTSSSSTSSSSSSMWMWLTWLLSTICQTLWGYWIGLDQNTHVLLGWMCFMMMIMYQFFVLLWNLQDQSNKFETNTMTKLHHLDSRSVPSFVCDSGDGDVADIDGTGSGGGHCYTTQYLSASWMNRHNEELAFGHGGGHGGNRISFQRPFRSLSSLFTTTDGGNDDDYLFDTNDYHNNNNNSSSFLWTVMKWMFLVSLCYIFICYVSTMIVHQFDMEAWADWLKMKIKSWLGIDTADGGSNNNNNNGHVHGGYHHSLPSTTSSYFPTQSFHSPPSMNSGRRSPSPSRTTRSTGGGVSSNNGGNNTGNKKSKVDIAAIRQRVQAGNQEDTKPQANWWKTDRSTSSSSSTGLTGSAKKKAKSSSSSKVRSPERITTRSSSKSKPASSKPATSKPAARTKLGSPSGKQDRIQAARERARLAMQANK